MQRNMKLDTRGCMLLQYTALLEGMCSLRLYLVFNTYDLAKLVTCTFASLAVQVAGSLHATQQHWLKINRILRGHFPVASSLLVGTLLSSCLTYVSDLMSTGV